MPIQRCTLNDKPGYRWGESGKCYTYEDGDEAGRKDAKRKAHVQGAAIEAANAKTATRKRLKRSGNTLVTLAASPVGKPRTEEYMGRIYRVIPAVLVRSQVLQNNLGRTYLPPEEFTDEWADRWNGIPVVLGAHPSRNGIPVSARSPDILNARGIGYVFGTKIVKHNNGARDLRGEVWIDETRAERVTDLSTLLEQVGKGTPVELSTGFPTMAEDKMGVFNGEDYAFILRPKGADHLAVFIDQIGACSVKHGCGLGVNAEARMAGRFNEADHPRHPSGSGKGLGGQFAPKSGGGAGGGGEGDSKDDDEKTPAWEEAKSYLRKGASWKETRRELEESGDFSKEEIDQAEKTYMRTQKKIEKDIMGPAMKSESPGKAFDRVKKDIQRQSRRDIKKVKVGDTVRVREMVDSPGYDAKVIAIKGQRLVIEGGKYGRHRVHVGSLDLPKEKKTGNMLARFMNWFSKAPMANQAEGDSDEQRRDRICRALQDEFGGGGDRYPWVEAIYSDDHEVIYGWSGPGVYGGQDFWKVTFEEAENGAITFGDPERVQKRVSYEPAGDNEEDAEMAFRGKPKEYEELEEEDDEDSDSGDEEMDEEEDEEEEMPPRKKTPASRNARADRSPHKREAGTMQRAEMIAHLAGTGPLTAEQLEKLSDCQLKALHGVPAENAGTTKEGVRAGTPDVKSDPAIATLQKQLADLVAANTARDEKIAAQEREIAVLKTTAQPIQEEAARERTTLLTRLSTNTRHGWSKEELEKMTTPDLARIHALTSGTSYAGQGGPRTAVNRGDDSEVAFVAPTPHWSEQDRATRQAAAAGKEK